MRAASASGLVSLRPPPDAAIGRVIAVVRRRDRRWVRRVTVLGAALVVAATLGSLAAWIWTARPPTAPGLLFGTSLIALLPFVTAQRAWKPPPLVVGEDGFEDRRLLRRLRVVTWSEVASLVEEGRQLRVVVRDREHFLARRGGRLSTLLAPFGYPSIRLATFEGSPNEVANLLKSTFEAWKARQR